MQVYVKEHLQELLQELGYAPDNGSWAGVGAVAAPAS